MEDGWNDWKRLIEKERGSLARHGLDRQTRGRRERQEEEERDGGSGDERDSECNFHIDNDKRMKRMKRTTWTKPNTG